MAQPSSTQDEDPLGDVIDIQLEILRRLESINTGVTVVTCCSLIVTVGILLAVFGVVTVEFRPI